MKRRLPTAFRLDNQTYELKKRSGQVAIYGVYTAYKIGFLGFEVIQTGPLAHDKRQRFSPDREVDAWRTFQELVDALR